MFSRMVLTWQTFDVDATEVASQPMCPVLISWRLDSKHRATILQEKRFGLGSLSPERLKVLWMFFSPVLLEDGRRRG